jgi:6-pyruvoyltetrahydropterin/6-carboxytetrahydropterin synthase
VKALLRLRREFDAAHQLPWHKGKCRRLHGHRWKVEVGIEGEVQPDDGAEDGGMVIDFGHVKALLDEILPDHLSLNDPKAAARDGLAVPDEASVWIGAMQNPTAENFAVKLYEEVGLRLAVERPEVRCTYVRVWETPGADVTYPAP